MDRNKKLLIAACTVSVILIIAVGILLAMAGRDKTPLSQHTLHLKVNGCDVEVPLKHDNVTVNVPCLEVGKNQFQVLGYPGGTVKVNDKTVKVGSTASIEVDSISSENQIEVKISNVKDSRTVRLRTYSSLLPKLRTIGKGAKNGEYLVTEADRPVMYALDNEGKVIWYKAYSAKKTKLRFSDFKCHQTDSGVYYSYQIINPEADNYGIADYHPGARVIMDEDFKVVTEDAGVTAYNPKKSIDWSQAGTAIDGNAFEMLSLHNTFTVRYNPTRVTNMPADIDSQKNTTVAAVILQNAGRSHVNWEWKSTSDTRLYSASVSGNDYTSSDIQDYLNPSAMVVDPKDQNLILSFKNADCLVKINSETGKLMWVLGGKADEFGLKDSQKFSGQTDVQAAADGTLTITQPGKITVMKLDENGKRVVFHKTKSIDGLVGANMESTNAETLCVGKSGKVLVEEESLNDGDLKNPLQITTTHARSLSSVRFVRLEDD
ncbi:MAG: aryl-sulfate sulfotransferase [Pseudoramibacter sp.]